MNYNSLEVGPFELLDEQQNVLHVFDSYEEVYFEACLVLGKKPDKIIRTRTDNIVIANFGINPDTGKAILIRYRLRGKGDSVWVNII